MRSRLKILACLWAAAVMSAAVPVEELARQAKSAMESARYAEAAAIYRQMLRDQPANAGLRFNLGLALNSSGNSSAAVAELERVTREQPQLSNAWLVLGLAYQKLGKPAAAIAPLERVIRIEPANRVAALELADAYLSSGRPRDALKYFRSLGASGAGEAKPLQGLANSYLSLAREMFERLNAGAASSPYAAALLAQSAFDRSQFRTAFGFARQARDAQPPIPDLGELIAAIYRASGHEDWARAVATGGARAGCGASDLACLYMADRLDDLLVSAGESNTPQALYWRSRAYSGLAGKALKRLEELPECAEWHEVLGEAYRLQDRKEDSIREWREAARLAPRDSYAQNGLARALWLHRSYAEAQPMVERLLRDSPESPELNYELGDILLEQQSVEDALPFLRKAISGGLQTPAAHGALGLALLKTGRASEAIPHLQAALPSDTDGSLYHQLGRAWTEAGDTTKARKYFDAQARIAAETSRVEQDITGP